MRNVVKRKELIRAAAEVKGPLCIPGGIPGWPESLLPLKTYKEWGIKMIGYPFLALYTAAKAIREANELLKSPELVSQDAVESKMMSFTDFNEIMRLPFWNTLAQKYEKE